ncbi:hypothetical protein [Paenibacillus hamazuiensis]|uniref:hypothetical protein n=1 Tax=Paenibacillus hamazuiensis TaxID=2936508 RepID=UPI00200FDEEF|nr:hypothetical protein [Paenibacillus hamazuiensis]
MVEDKQQANFQDDREDEFLRERLRKWNGPVRDPFYEMMGTRSRKSKLIAGLLSFLVPGTGQFYLGQMQRGITIMLLLIVDIFAIVTFSTSSKEIIPLIVLFSLLIPVIYFYNIFDALQQADKINHRPLGFGPEPFYSEAGDARDPLGRLAKGSYLGYLLVAVGVLLFLVGAKPAWLEKLLDLVGSSVGAILLIGIGVYLFFRESRNK